MAFTEIVPSAYEETLTMDGSAQSRTLASGVTRVRVANQGASSEDIRVTFGRTTAEAEAALAIDSGAATAGLWIGAAPDGFDADVVLGVPAGMTAIAVANATASDGQDVSITQGK